MQNFEVSDIALGDPDAKLFELPSGSKAPSAAAHPINVPATASPAPCPKTKPQHILTLCAQGEPDSPSYVPAAAGLRPSRREPPPLPLVQSFRLEDLGSRLPILFTSPRVALISSVRTATKASRARSITRSCRTSRLRCCIDCNECGSTRPNRANLLASIRSFFRLRRIDPSINRGLATNTSCP